MELDKRIEKFILKHHVFTLATAQISSKGESEPYCSNMFYAYHSQKVSLVFSSSDDTRHGQEMLNNSLVGGSVVLETTVVGKLQGLQFQGRVSKVKDDSERACYLKKYPFAVLKELNLWSLEIHSMKFTDNRLGFGKKLFWSYDK